VQEAHTLHARTKPRVLFVRLVVSLYNRAGETYHDNVWLILLRTRRRERVWKKGCQCGGAINLRHPPEPQTGITVPTRPASRACLCRCTIVAFCSALVFHSKASSSGTIIRSTPCSRVQTMSYAGIIDSSCLLVRRRDRLPKIHENAPIS